MAAGLGFKTFSTGDVLSATDVNGYLMQGILVFASAAARDAAITAPAEGQFAYLKDTNVTTYYTGSAWANVDTTGMTNPMTTTGDIIYSSSGSTPARLGIGTSGQVIGIAAGVPAWTTPASGGGMTLISTTSLTGSSIDLTSIAGTYVDLRVEISDYYPSADAILQFRINNDTSTRRAQYYAEINKTTGNLSDDIAINTTTLTNLSINNTTDNVDKNNLAVLEFFNYTSTGPKFIRSTHYFFNETNTECFNVSNIVIDATAAISSIQIITNAGTFSAGTVKLWGIK
jgi:hypothetical protein